MNEEMKGLKETWVRKVIVVFLVPLDSLANLVLRERKAVKDLLEKLVHLDLLEKKENSDLLVLQVSILVLLFFFNFLIN